jgi:hypothetical protein
MCYEDFNKAHEYPKKGFNTAKTPWFFSSTTYQEMIVRLPVVQRFSSKKNKRE